MADKKKAVQLPEPTRRVEFAQQLVQRGPRPRECRWSAREGCWRASLARSWNQRLMRSDVENFLIPSLGRYRLADLDTRLLRTVFAHVAATTNSKGLPHPDRTTYKIAFTISRRGCFSLRPSVFGSGNNGSINAHWASVRSEG